MAKLISTNPAKNYQILGKVEISTEEDIREKVQKAQTAKLEWKELGIEGRVKILRQLVEKLAQRKEEIAQLATKEMGIPIRQSRQDTDSAIQYFISYLDHSNEYLAPEISYENDQMVHKVFYEPIGVVAVITPWNFPISNFVWGACQNLVAGNTVVFKHSEECPLFGRLIEEIVSQSNLPEGVFNEVYGDGQVGDSLVCQDVDLICFTGSSQVGQHLYRVGAEKFIKVLLELGGSSPGIICEDADIDAVLASIYSARFDNNGQMCDAIKRLIVHESRVKEAVEKLQKLLESKKVGDPDDPETDFGPLVAKRQLLKLQEQIEDAVNKGAKVVIGGKSLEEELEGAFYAPTLLTGVTRDMKVWQEEVFGPVLPVVTFKTDQEAIELANDTKYGLGAYVFTQNKKRALKVAGQLEAGMVSINNAYYLNPASPFGGYKMSGMGREHGKYGLQDLSQIKVVAIEK